MLLRNAEVEHDNMAPMASVDLFEQNFITSQADRWFAPRPIRD